MSYDASIYGDVFNPPTTAEVVLGISCEERWRPGTIIKSAQSQLKNESLLVADRLMRECFKRKSPRGSNAR
ncbi:hypothetical protein [Bradyrhizobium sp.]|uniref:hypothetical protein n=1 Tax=Bradyrhizobium sp. TaxID=376 RepID=UPI003BB15A71